MRRIGLAVTIALSFTIALSPASAQQAQKIPRIGFLSLGAAVPPDAFVQRLRELGYSDKQNLTIEYRFAEGRHDAMNTLASNLARLKVDVIMAWGDEAIAAAKRTTSTIPIVMLACDALTAGFVASLAHPGGNITGVTCVTSELSAKRVALLREATPKASRVGVLFNPANVSKPPDANQTRIAAEGMGLKVQTREVLERVDIDGAFLAFAREHAEAVIVLDDAFIFLHARRVAELALKQRLPTMHVWPQSVAAGGLMSYGPNPDEMLRLAATYVDRVLKGAKPADLPVEQPTKFELVINLKTAKALGLTIPQTLMLRADQIIE